MFIFSKCYFQQETWGYKPKNTGFEIIIRDRVRQQISSPFMFVNRNLQTYQVSNQLRKASGNQNVDSCTDLHQLQKQSSPACVLPACQISIQSGDASSS